jgi:hypothetical protein
MTVGPGITPGLLTLTTLRLPSARGLDALRVITAGGESHPALRTLPSSIDGGDFLSHFFEKCIVRQLIIFIVRLHKNA